MKTLIGERWEDVEGYEGVYQVSDKGRVRSLDRVDSLGRDHTGQVLKVCFAGDGYGRVNLKRDGDRKSALVHRLVATAFIPNPRGAPAVNHLDSSRGNNVATNLEWCTASQNIQHCIRNGRFHPARGSKSGKAVLCEADVYFIKTSPLRNMDIAALFGIARNHVSEIRRGRIWQHVVV
jgi:hypothetical protein